MTDAERAALGWLDSFGTYQGDNYVILKATDHARTIRALLAEPRLPAEPTSEILKALMEGWWAENPYTVKALTQGYRALYAHLTKPKTKTVWRVLHETAAGRTGGVDAFEEWSDATAELSRLIDAGYRVTIERREVPA